MLAIQNQDHPFLTSNYTIEDYIQDAATFTEIQDHHKALKSCVAIGARKGFIIKQYNPETNSFNYRTYTITALAERLNLTFNIEVSSTTVNKKTHETKTEIVEIPYSPMKDLKSNFRSELLAYKDVDIFSSNPQVLSLYFPPRCDEPNDSMIADYIKDMEQRFTNPEAFHELLATHAFRLRHPDVNVVKFFVLFSVLGKTGKTTLMEHIDLLYPNLSIIGVKSKTVTSEFTGWMTNYLNIGFEELENDEYRNKFFETFLKQITTRKTSVRNVYENVTTGTNRAIVMINTNSPDLYGMIYADQALLSRMVVLDFKPPVSIEDGKAFKKKYGFDDTADDYKDRLNLFAASFYHYLRYVYPIPEGFTTERYDGKDKYEIIQRLRQNSQRLPMRFIKKLSIKPEQYTENPYAILEVHRTKKPVVEHVFVSEEKLAIAFQKYLCSGFVSTKERGMYSVNSVFQELEKSLGWCRKRYKSNTIAGYDILKVDYDKWISEQSIPTEEDESEDDTDEFESELPI